MAYTLHKSLLLISALALSFAAQSTKAASYQEPPVFKKAVASGVLPPISSRVPIEPSVVALEANGLVLGKYGGSIRTIMGRAKDIRMLSLIHI